MVMVIRCLLFGLSVQVVHSVTRCNSYVGIFFGVGVTLLVQSSSIVTCLLVPLGGAGAISMENIYPIVIGANLGAAMQAVVRARVTAGTAPPQVALTHLFLSLSGFLIWYLLPPLRAITLRAAHRLGEGAAI